VIGVSESARALTVPCPRCKAPVGVKCRGGVAHRERVAGWRERKLRSGVERQG
jgi:hypothetical protein